MSRSFRDLLKFSAPLVLSAALLAGCGSGGGGSADLDEGGSTDQPDPPVSNVEDFKFKSTAEWFVSGTPPVHARFTGGTATDAGDGKGYWIIPAGKTGVIDFGTPATAVKFSTTDDFTVPAAAAAQKAGAVNPGSQAVSPPFDVAGGVYIRGLGSDWTVKPERRFVEVSENIMEVILPLTTAIQADGEFSNTDSTGEFKVADGGWTSPNCGSGGDTARINIGQAYVLNCSGGSANIDLTIPEDADYRFRLDTTGSTEGAPAATLTITKVTGDGNGGEPEPVEDSTIITIFTETVVDSTAGPTGTAGAPEETKGKDTIAVDKNLGAGSAFRITRIEIENTGTNGDIGIADFSWTADAQFALAPETVDLYYSRPTGSVAGTTITVGGETYDCVAPPEDSPYGCVAKDVVVTPYANAPMTVDNSDGSSETITFNGGSGAEDVYAYSGTALASTGTPAPAPTISQAAAHWVDAATLLFNPPAGATSVELLASPDASIVTGPQGISGTYQTIATGAGTNPKYEFNRQLHSMQAWTLQGVTAEQAKDVIRGQLVAIARDVNGKILGGTRVQAAGALDALYAEAAYDAQLGVSYASGVPTLAVWAPTALEDPGVSVNVYDDAADTEPETFPMTLDEATGIWSVAGTADWDRKFYTISLRVFSYAANDVVDNVVTDPYSVSLAMDSVRSQFVNLDDAALKPEGWDTLAKPALEAPEDIVLYELHVRDFSAYDPDPAADSESDNLKDADRGKFTAFADPDFIGVQHLKSLADAGLTHVHILPAFDIATIKENPADQVNINDPVERLCEKNTEAASLCATDAGKTIRKAIEDAIAANQLERPPQIMQWIREYDGFNWGYDPYHFGVPEGSYSTDPQGPARILEFRRMVKGLNELGLRTVMDVVYNHTNQSGQQPRSVLDKIVPGYYHRRDNTSGAVLNNSCCQDTAGEFRMMEKLMIDTGKTWVDDYKVSGFRFDLMGMHTVESMTRFRDAVTAIEPTVYLYGEGWNCCAGTDDERIHQARQANLGGTGIGSFSDRMRDIVRGGGPFDSPADNVEKQGFISGWFYDPNSSPTYKWQTDSDADDEIITKGSATDRQVMIAASDNVRVWLAGGLAGYRLQNAAGQVVPGSAIDYPNPGPGRQGSGYTSDPQEAINYADKHDNRTLWDYSELKNPAATSIADRVRVQNMGNSLLLLAQGVPFLHAGTDMLRSKSGDTDSYDSGDWHNELDWTLAGEKHKWAQGLPIADKNSSIWPILLNAYLDPTTKPGSADLQRAFDHVREMLQIRKSSLLFRLRDAAQVNVRVRFYNTGPSQIPGVIAMGIDGCTDADFVPGEGALMTIFNASDEARTLNLLGTEAWTLHPVLANSTDPIVRTAKHDANGFYVPARTTAVFRRAAQTSCVPYPTDLYVRGSFNDWVNPAPSGYQMKFLGGTSYSLTAPVPAGAQQFKVAARSWGDYPDCGASVAGQVVELGAPAVLTCAANTPNLELPASTEAGDYVFALDATDRVNPTLTVTRAVDLFVRGEMNGWADPPPDSARMRFDGNGKYRAALSGLDAVSYNFKIADAGWGASTGGATNCGASAGGNTVTPAQPYVMLCPSNDNMSITLPAAGSYVFAADFENPAAPTLTVTPTTFDFSVFVRGGFNGWADPPPANAELFEIGGGLLSRTIKLPLGATEFKVADASWGLFNCGGGTVTLGAPVALSCGGSSPNTSFSVPTEGYYSFTLDANSPDAPTVTVTGP